MQHCIVLQWGDNKLIESPRALPFLQSWDRAGCYSLYLFFRKPITFNQIGLNYQQNNYVMSKQMLKIKLWKVKSDTFCGFDFTKLSQTETQRLSVFSLQITAIVAVALEGCWPLNHSKSLSSMQLRLKMPIVKFMCWMSHNCSLIFKVCCKEPWIRLVEWAPVFWL